jgi:hypothetical protein
MARWLSPSHTKGVKILAAAGAGAVLIAAVREFGAVDSLWVTVAIGVGGMLLAFGLKKWRSSHFLVIPVLVAIALFFEVLL